MSDTAAPRPALEIRDLKIEAKSNDRWNTIVNGVSVTVRPGEVVGLVAVSYTHLTLPTNREV